MPDRPDEHRRPGPTRATPRGRRESGVRRVGHYRIDGELGRGGMGVVYRAVDERLHREVALKALPEELIGDREQLARLEREARALALVSHPNVAAIHGMEQAGSACYLVLELVAGETLRERLDRGRLDVDEAVALCAHVAADLAAVHRKGLVHRDLKPSNVMVTTDGIAKLLDFGLARQSRSEGRVEVTRGGDVMGTSGWMSPEQLRGEELDARSDAWAWGCLLYECLAGTRAFAGSTESERNAAALRDEPAWERLPEVPTAVVGLLKSCLSKSRSARPDTMDEVHRLLEQARHRSSERRAAAALPKHSLPAERDAFVGREAELAELRSLLDEGHRLVSVLGLGGTGKTRLVLRLARASLERFPGGAWFCDLSEARSVEGIVAAVATALDVPLGRDDRVAQLGHAIAGRGKCLVVLDNFEQVARHAEDTLGPWLDRCFEAAFVVTTREVLGLAGEAHVALQPLSQAEAEELFVVRARMAHHGFGPNDAERREIARLVEELDRLPLAVELAAARTRVMPVQQLLARMTERFKLLAGTGARRDRQATLRATFDWSWDLLSDDERRALAQLSVFEGGFTLEAAEAVLALEELWPADAVHALLDKSWVRRSADGRFDLLVSVQEYAAEKLEAAEARTETEARHGKWFASLGGEGALEALQRHGGVAKLRALADELDNLAAACRRATARGDGESAVATLSATWRVVEQRGPASMTVALAEGVLGIARLAPALDARASWTLGVASDAEGQAAKAQEHHERALATYRALGDRRFEGMVRSTLGSLCRGQGRTGEAREHYERGLEIHREVGDRRSEGTTLANLSLVSDQLGGVDVARQQAEEALAIHREVGNRRNEGIVLGNLGIIHRRQGRLDQALAHYEESLAISREVGNRRTEGIVLGNLGVLRLDQGRVDEALADYENALAIQREVGDRRSEAVVLSELGVLLGLRGQVTEAREHYEQALAIHREVGNRRYEGNVLGNLGMLQFEQGRMDEARQHLEEALAIHREVGHLRAEGYGLGDLAMLHLEQGRLDEARARLDAGERLLRDLRDPVELGQILCLRVHLEAGTGRDAAALAALAEAEALALDAGTGAGSGLARALERARVRLDGPAS